MTQSRRLLIFRLWITAHRTPSLLIEVRSRFKALSSSPTPKSWNQSMVILFGSNRMISLASPTSTRRCSWQRLTVISRTQRRREHSYSYGSECLMIPSVRWSIVRSWLGESLLSVLKPKVSAFSSMGLMWASRNLSHTFLASWKALLAMNRGSWT